jgi:hypothetical protein
MSTYSDNKITIKQYLLGTLSPEKQCQVEETLLTSQQYFDELLVEEDELIDDYLDSGLTQAEREQFENYFLATPERIDKLRFARLLRGYLDKDVSAQAVQRLGDTRTDSPTFLQSVLIFFKTGNPAIRFSLAALLLVAVCGGLLIGIMRWQRRVNTDQIARTSQPEETPVGEPGSNRHALSPSPPETPTPPVFAVSLSSGLERNSGATKRIVVPKGANTLQLRLELMTDDYARYRALLKTDAQDILIIAPLKTESAKGEKYVVLNLPAGLLKPDDYQVVLSGETDNGPLEDISKYVFRIPSF